MKYNIISTGSQGNAVVVDDIILVDCGVSFKALSAVYKKLKIVLLTHSHCDHITPVTLRRLSQERPTLRFGCCKWLVKTLVESGVPKENIDVYEVGKLYDYGLFKVSPVRLYHDVPNAGYRIFKNGKKALYATDTQHMQGISAKNYDLYLIEGNYGEDELQERIKEKQKTGEFCYELKVAQRHLSREQASAFLLENMGENSRYEFIHCHREENEDV